MHRQRLNTLIPDAYDASWTRLGDGFFHAYVPPGAPGYGQDQASLEPGATDEYPWLSNGQSIFLSQNVATGTPVVLADNYRNLLIIQNNSSATAPDVAPILYVNVNGPVQLASSAATSVSGGQYSLAFPPGFGILMDVRVLTNALYVAYGNISNTNNSVRVAGVITYGRTPNSPPLIRDASDDAFDRWWATRNPGSR
jgi:hypothetical protein